MVVKRIVWVMAAVVVGLGGWLTWLTVQTYRANAAVLAREESFAAARAKHPYAYIGMFDGKADYADNTRTGKGAVAIVTVYFDEQASLDGAFRAERNTMLYSCEGGYYTLKSSERLDASGASQGVVEVNSDFQFLYEDLGASPILAYACRNTTAGEGFPDLAAAFRHTNLLASRLQTGG